MAKLNTLTDQVKALEVKTDKVLGEVTALRAEFELLKAQLEDAEIPADAQATIDRIGDKLAAIDALNPDAAPPPA